MRKFASLLAAALSALPMFAATSGQAQQRAVAGGVRVSPPSQSGHFSWERGQGFHGGFGGGVWIVERAVPVIVEVPVVVEAPPAPPPAPSPEGEGKKRKPYVVGGSYASLPGGCMKLIEEGASYYFCGDGEWYRQVGQGRSATYRAIKRAAL